ncbi:MAG: HAD family hydrolase [Enterocloster clostridioformis]
MPEEAKCAFAGVREALKASHDTADVAVVSSANQKAVEEEWQRQGLMEYVDVVLSQDAGSKSACINALLKKGYSPDHVLMVGDAPETVRPRRTTGILLSYPGKA